jgi:hypothetical protein
MITAQRELAAEETRMRLACLVQTSTSLCLCVLAFAVDARSEEEQNSTGQDAALVQKEQSKKKDEKDKGDSRDPVFQVNGRIHAGWDMKHREEIPAEGVEENENTFLIRRARISFKWEPTDRIMAVLEIGAEEIFEAGTSFLRDAYLHFSPSRFVELRVGQFKKPFSSLELCSPGRLRVIERGESNNLIVRDLTYGYRDLGIQLSGRLVKSVKLDYEIGAFNGSGPLFEDSDMSKDIVARLSVRPIKSLAFGANASLKLFDRDDDNKSIRNDMTRAAAFGADVRIRLFGIRLDLEGLAAQDHLFKYRANKAEEPYWILGGIGILSYRHEFPVSWRLAAEPVVKGEILDPNAELADDEVFVIGPGLNTYFGKYTRLMIHSEFRHSKRNADAGFADWMRLMAQICFDI